MDPGQRFSAPQSIEEASFPQADTKIFGLTRGVIRDLFNFPTLAAWSEEMDNLAIMASSTLHLEQVLPYWEQAESGAMEAAEPPPDKQPVVDALSRIEVSQISICGLIAQLVDIGSGVQVIDEAAESFERAVFRLGEEGIGDLKSAAENCAEAGQLMSSVDSLAESTQASYSALDAAIEELRSDIRVISRELGPKQAEELGMLGHVDALSETLVKCPIPGEFTELKQGVTGAIQRTAERAAAKQGQF